MEVAWRILGALVAMLLILFAVWILSLGKDENERQQIEDVPRVAHDRAHFAAFYATQRPGSLPMPPVTMDQLRMPGPEVGALPMLPAPATDTSGGWRVLRPGVRFLVVGEELPWDDGYPLLGSGPIVDAE